MLPRKNRLSKRVFSQVWGKGKTTPSPFFIVRTKKIDTDQGSGCAVVVSKKVAPRATARNKMRRRVYAAIRDIKLIHRGEQRIVVVRKDIAELSYEQLLLELTNAFS